GRYFAMKKRKLFCARSLTSDVQPPYNLEGANISGAIINMANNTGSNFSGVIATKTQFFHQIASTYSHVDFSNAILIESDFSYANLTEARFDGANVRDANFSNANLYGATGINFAVVKSVCDAIMPDGSKGVCK
ncbi:MAG: pentapeptide repeat-containing protein, partial [Francisellaceae bacterium]